jgi:hypothetical protein
MHVAHTPRRRRLELAQRAELRRPSRTRIRACGCLAPRSVLTALGCCCRPPCRPAGEEEELTLIDFPQMVSTTHANGDELFSRDVECIVRFFSKKIGCAIGPDHMRTRFSRSWQLEQA